MNLRKDIFAALGNFAEPFTYQVAPDFLQNEKRFLFTRNVSERVASYLIINDQRAGGGNLVFTLWIAPKQFPDDSIEVLNIGYKIVLYDGYEMDENIFQGILKKAMSLDPFLGALVPQIETELDKPYFSNRRHLVFEETKKYFNCARLHKVFEELQNFGREVITGNQDYDDFLDRAKRFVVNYDENMKQTETLACFDHSDKAEFIAEFIIAYALFEMQ